MNILVFLSTLFITAVSKHVLLDPELDEHWEDFKKAFNKTYEGREAIARRVIWEQRVAEIVRHNLKADVGHYSYKKGLNAFSDMEHSELVQTLNGLRLKTNGKPMGNSSWMPPAHMLLPGKVDWRDEGMVTDVKNQGQCGSCWAFSATGSLEGQQKRKSGQLVSLSEQNLIDCSRPLGNQGCNGGIMDLAFSYVKDNGGIDTEESYQYIGKDDQPCKFQSSTIGGTCTGLVNLPQGDEEALMQAVATVGPISVGIDASQDSFQMYSSGVYDEPNCSPDRLDHGVLVIGYGTEDGKDYWLVKNSWGTSWGMKGYVMMSRNKNNQCGIATHAVYPLV